MSIKRIRETDVTKAEGNTRGCVKTLATDSIWVAICHLRWPGEKLTMNFRMGSGGEGEVLPEGMQRAVGARSAHQQD